MGRGDGLDRRDGDEHRDPRQRSGVRLRDRPDLPAARLRLSRGQGNHHRAPAAGLLPGRAPHRLPDPRRALRRRRGPPRRHHLPRDPEPRRRAQAHGRGARARGRPPDVAGRRRRRRRARPGPRAVHHPAHPVDRGDGRAHHRLHVARRADRGAVDGHGAARGVPGRLDRRGGRPSRPHSGRMGGGGQRPAPRRAGSASSTSPRTRPGATRSGRASSAGPASPSRPTAPIS